MLLILLLWILNGFDLAFTVMAGDLGQFIEGNPLARWVLDDPYAVYSFKIGSMALATAILFVFRRHRAAEAACWGLCAVYALLSVYWLNFFLDYRRRQLDTRRPPRASYALTIELERPGGQAYQPVAPHVYQQPQRQAVHHQA